MRFVLSVVAMALLSAFLALPCTAKNRLNLYTDMQFDVTGQDSSGGPENVNTRVALGYLIGEYMEAGIQASQNAEDRSIQDVGVWMRFNLTSRDSADAALDRGESPRILYGRLAITGMKRDISGDVPDVSKAELNTAAGLELVMGKHAGAFTEADIRYLWDAQGITEFSVRTGMIFYLR